MVTAYEGYLIKIITVNTSCFRWEVWQSINYIYGSIECSPKGWITAELATNAAKEYIDGL